MEEDRRRSFRMAVSPGQDQGLLRVKRRELPVRILNISRFGFGLVVLRPANFSVGQVLHLRTAAGWTEISIVRIAQHEEGTLLGVERLQELSGDPDRSGGGSIVTALAVGVLALVGGVLAITYWPYDPERRQPRKPAEVVSIVMEQAQQTWQELRN